MKNLNRNVKVLFLFGIFYIMSIPVTYACGTVEGWAEIYLEGKEDHSKQKVLSMIHCEPTVFNADIYKASPEEHELLSKVIADALNDNDLCVQLLAVKNFFIFDNLFWIHEKEIYKDISRKIEKIIKMPVNEVRGHLSAYSFQSYQQYCEIVEKEINGEEKGDRFSCYGRGQCKPIDFSHLRKKIQKPTGSQKKVQKTIESPKKVQKTIESPKKVQKAIESPKKTDPCPAKSDSKLIVKVKSDTLNLRSEPNTKSQIVTKLTKNDLLYVIKKKSGWLYITTEKCKKGWVAAYLTKDAESE